MARWSDRLLAAVLLGGLLSGGGAVGAQELATGVLADSPIEILTIDQERLYTGSKFGQTFLADIDNQLRALQSENRKIESDLEAEEQHLTDQRAGLPAEEFHKLASDFDAKVKQIRAARDAKERDIGLQRDLAQKKFLSAAVPILAQIMRERGASAIIDRKAVFLSFERIDITDAAIARIDAELAGSATQTPGTPGSTPDATPETPVPQDQPQAAAPEDGSDPPAESGSGTGADSAP